MLAPSRLRTAHNKGMTASTSITGRKFYVGSTRQRLAFVWPLIISVCVTLGAAQFDRSEVQLIAPNVKAFEPVPTATPEPVPVQATIFSDMAMKDLWIGGAVDEFMVGRESEGRKIMHCLANQESKHGEDKGHGDGGLAGGPFQFHESTWQNMRTTMRKAGLIHEIGSRYDFKEAARTTAWAIAHGRAYEWGPIARAAKGSDRKTCPVPSWYKK